MKRAGQGARADLASSRRLSLGKALLAAILACCLQAAGAAEPFQVAVARNLVSDGASRKTPAEPVVLLFSRAGCTWCERLKQQHLRHLPREVVLREVDIGSDAPLVDFAGLVTTHRRFATAMSVRLAPTLAFFSPDGRQLVEPIVGVRGADYMDYFIETALAASRQRLNSQ
jgi:thioredoxin-related protein